MTLVDLIFPKKCVGCGKFGEFLCSDCFSKIRFNDNFVCPTCFKRSTEGMTHSKCQRKDGIDGIVPALTNNGVVKKLIKKFKNERLFTLADTLGQLMTESLSQNEGLYDLLQEKPIIVSIPIDHSTLRKQGFNHCELLTDYVAQYFKLKKVRGLLGYSGDKVKLRWKNKIASYVVLVDLESNFSILNSTAKILKDAGIRKVIGVTLVSQR